jgi:hypothetical protein
MRISGESQSLQGSELGWPKKYGYIGFPLRYSSTHKKMSIAFLLPVPSEGSECIDIGIRL